MAFCSQCGAKVEDGARFCTACGAKIDQGSGNQTVAPVPAKDQKQRGQQNQGSQNGFAYEKFVAYTDTTASYSEEDRNQNRLVAVLSYIHILVLVPLIGMRESPFTQYHAKIGLNLLLWHLVAEIGGKIITGILGWIPVIGWLISIAVALINLVLWAFNVFGIIAAAQGKARELEIFEPFKIIK